MAKKKCYPRDLSISETKCEIPLQRLLDHTSNRILQIPSLPKIENNMHDFTIIYKWGCDGSSGYSQYKQKYSTPTSVSDNNLFLFSIVPLQFRCSVDNSNIVLWQNPRPSSPRFCRPIKFMFKKETTDVTIENCKTIEKQISLISMTNIFKEEIQINIKHILNFTMVDGKVKLHNK